MSKLCVLLTIIVHQTLADVSKEGRLSCPAHVGSRCIYQGTPSSSEYMFKIYGYSVNIEFQDGNYLKIPCNTVTLDNDALPRFTTRLTIKSVFLNNCPAPNKSLADTLAALNITGYSKLTINHVPPQPPLRKEHFSNLNISWLILRADRKVILEPGSLSNLNLTELELTNVFMDKLPIGLKSLILKQSGIRSLSIEVIKSLKELKLVDTSLTDVGELENATELRRLYLGGLIGELPAMPWLEVLTLDNWVMKEPKPWSNCDELRNLTVYFPSVSRLPDDWLAVCPKLNRLDLGLMNLEAVSPHVFRGCSSVEEIAIKRSRIKELPLELFESAKKLTRLDLSHNKLEYLPSGVFSNSLNIQDLNLSNNHLTAGNITAVESLLLLRNLDLSYNRLGSMCDTGTASIYTRATSRLQTLKELRNLVMASSEVPAICDDWITYFPFLTTLNLSGNSITTLRYHNILPRAATEIDLRGNNITNIIYTEDDCTTVVKELATVSMGTIKINSKLVCDCHLFNFAYARQTSPRHVNIHSLRCTNGKYLSDIPAGDLYCDLTPPRDCVPGCECEMIPNSRPLSCSSVFEVRARCDAKALPDLYALDPMMDPVELAVTGIQDLGVLKLDGKLQKINLTSNRISNASAAVSRSLLSRGRKVSLSGNPLDCTCGERYLVEELLSHPNQVEDFSEIQCSDLSYLNELNRDCSLLPSGALAALGVLAVAAFAAMGLAAVLATPHLRLRFKIYLFKLGITLPCIQEKEEDEGKRYDAFISFSHHDGRLVMEEIVPVLEKDYQLCLHYRDWPLGGWIPEQIATSVRDSRRTIIVVSEHYARSDWARAEFREAHAAAMRDSQPRLLAVLLQEPPPELDAELKLYLSTNTYVKWGDPAFWDKLRYAMPRKRMKNFLPETA